MKHYPWNIKLLIAVGLFYHRKDGTLLKPKNFPHNTLNTKACNKDKKEVKELLTFD